MSFLSPCVLPLVPGYVSLISGAGVEELKSQEAQLLRKVMLNSVGFILGFSVVFITLGAISTEVGQLLARYKSLFAQIAGVVIILFGLHLTGNRICFRFRVDSVRGSNSGGDPGIRCGAGFRAEGHHSSRRIFAWPRRSLSADVAGN